MTPLRCLEMVQFNKDLVPAGIGSRLLLALPNARGGLWVGDRGCDPRIDWLLCLGATCPLVVAGPARLEVLA